MATTKKCIKVVFNTNKDVGNNNSILGKLSRTNVVSITIKYTVSLILFNLVTIITAKTREKKAILMSIKKVVKNILVLGK